MQNFPSFDDILKIIEKALNAWPYLQELYRCPPGVKVLIERAYRHAKLRQYNEAISILRDVESKASRYPKLYMLLAWCYAQMEYDTLAISTASMTLPFVRGAERGETLSLIAELAYKQFQHSKLGRDGFQVLLFDQLAYEAAPERVRLAWNPCETNLSIALDASDLPSEAREEHVEKAKAYMERVTEMARTREGDVSERIDAILVDAEDVINVRIGNLADPWWQVKLDDLRMIAAEIATERALGLPRSRGGSRGWGAVMIATLLIFAASSYSTACYRSDNLRHYAEVTPSHHMEKNVTPSPQTKRVQQVIDDIFPSPVPSRVHQMLEDIFP